MQRGCRISGIIYLGIFSIYFYYSYFSYFVTTNAYLLIITFLSFIFLLSILYLFFLEIKKSVIIGLSISSVLLICYLYINRLDLLWNTILMIVLLGYNLIHLLRMIISNKREESIVRKAVLNLGSKVVRLKIKEIAEFTKVDTSTVLKTIRIMINNEQIYAEYFKSSKTVAINQLANLENIDKLMDLYHDWEKIKIKKD
jgi:hypothetical protein